MSSALHPDGKTNPCHTSSNESGNPSLHDLIEARKLSRRTFLQGSLGITAAAAFGGSLFDGLIKYAHAAPAPLNGVGFSSVPPNLYLSAGDDRVTVPAGYTARVLAAWGDSLTNAPHWDPSGAMTAWSVVGADNTVAIYMGDDERNEYLYKFVCANKYNPRNRAANRDLLDSGTLFVARFDAGGSGIWLPLTWGQNGLVPENGFADQAEVLIKTRQAADRLGATMMDRPEWIASHPVTREVYMTLTNNNRRGSNPPSGNNPDGTTGAGSARPPVDAANPRPDNRYGHIIRWRESMGKVDATAFEWDIFVECGDRLDPQPHHQGNIIGDDYGAPDGLWFDQDGRLWIQTDQIGNATGDWANIGGNVMLCADPSTGETRRFLTAPKNCEVTGVTHTPDGKTLFIGIQHPGEDWETHYTENSTWPDSGINGPTTASGGSAPASKPRSAVVAITKDDGGVIGT